MSIYGNIGINRGNRGNRIMCKASEFGKYVVNKCIESDYDINTSKLQKLLVLIHGEMLAKYDVPLFEDDVLCWKCGVAIQRVNDDFTYAAYEFSKEKFTIYIAILNIEEEITNKVLKEFGKCTATQINYDSRLKELCQEHKLNEVIGNQQIRRVFIKYE